MTMARRPNTLPTSIYLLIDCRPETIARGWAEGEPFYCGKTIRTLRHRFRQHLNLATADLESERALLPRIRECDGHVKIILIDTVPAGGNWWDRERAWIAWCRATYPGMVNTTDGGEGVPGLICSEKTKEKLRNLYLGKPLSPETKAKISKALMGRVATPETRAKLSASNTGKKASPETKKRLRESHIGKGHTPETRAKIGATLKKRPVTEKQIRDLNKARSLRKFGPEFRAKVSAGRKGKKLPAEHYAKLSKLFKGKKQPPEVVAKRTLAIKCANLVRRIEKNHPGVKAKYVIGKVRVSIRHVAA